MLNQTNILKRTLLECFLKTSFIIIIVIAISLVIYGNLSSIQVFFLNTIKPYSISFLMFLAKQNYLFFIPFIPVFAILFCHCSLCKISENQNVEDSYLRDIYKIFQKIQVSIIAISCLLFSVFLGAKLTEDKAELKNVAFNSLIPDFVLITVLILVILFSFYYLIFPYNSINH